MNCSRIPDSSYCQKGPILSFSYGLNYGAGTFAGNAQAGVAMNLRTGDAATFAELGNTIGAAWSNGWQLTIQAGTLAGLITDPQAGTNEIFSMYKVFSAGNRRGSVAIGFDGWVPSSFTIGTKGFAAAVNFTGGGLMTRTINLYKNLDPSFTCAKVGVGCTR